jgi:hypothetical protein
MFLAHELGKGACAPSLVRVDKIGIKLVDPINDNECHVPPERRGSFRAVLSQLFAQRVIILGDLAGGVQVKV